MAGPENTPDSSAFGRLLHSEARFLSRVAGVLRFDSAVYEEIEKDPHAIPQAFAAVIATALLAGLGQGSLAAIFVGIALAILIWAGVTGLVWGVGVLMAGPASHFPSLLRCLGFAYIWVGLLIGSGLPYLGGLFSWGAVLLYLASLVLATRQVLQTTTGRATLISAIALGFPLLILLLIAG